MRALSIVPRLRLLSKEPLPLTWIFVFNRGLSSSLRNLRRKTSMPRVRSSCAVVLPPNAEPRHYVLSLSPNMETFTFDGTVDVTVDIVEETSTLVLHSKELTYLGKTTFTGADGTSTKATTHTVDHDRTTVTFTFASPLAVGLGGILHIDFQGELNADMCGFYRSTYKNVRGESKFMLSTQFEALDARRCFPCWDEPARKATFGTKLIVDEGLTAFSNMPVTEQTLLAGGKKVRLFFILLYYITGFSTNIMLLLNDYY